MFKLQCSVFYNLSVISNEYIVQVNNVNTFKHYNYLFFKYLIYTNKTL